MPVPPVLDGVARDVKYACRQLLRAPLAALTIVVTVGLGLGLVAAVYTILNAMVFRVDEVRNPHELFSVERQRSAIAQAEMFTTSSTKRCCARRTCSPTRSRAPRTCPSGSRASGARAALVTGNFFGVLGVGAELGRALTRLGRRAGPTARARVEPSAWVQHYDSDPAVRRQLLPSQWHAVSSRRRDARRVPRARDRGCARLLGAVLARSTNCVSARAKGPAVSRIVGRLAPGVSQGQALAQLIAWDAQRAAEAAAPATSAQRRASCSRRSSARCRGRPRPCWCSCRCSSRSG